MRALVSADDVAAAISAHADNLYDAAGRLGCAPAEATAAADAAASGLIADLVGRPETVGDLVGGLYARCRHAADQVRRVRSDDPRPDADDIGDPEARATAAALAELPERRRLGVLMLDAYGVTYAQAGVALGLDAAETARTVALGRATLVRAADGPEVPPLAGHDTAVGDLGMLSDGSAPAGGRFAALRKHVSNCATCAGMLGVQTLGKARVGALPRATLEPSRRADFVAAARSYATAALPSAEQVQEELSRPVERPRLISGLLVVVLLVAALILGAVLGIVLGDRNRPTVLGQRACSISATRNASSIDCPVLSRGSHAVS